MEFAVRSSPYGSVPEVKYLQVLHVIVSHTCAGASTFGLQTAAMEPTKTTVGISVKTRAWLWAHP